MNEYKPSNIDSIQYLRGIAALMVVIFHASRETRQMFGEEMFAWGEFGVDIFFVISGFVMVFSISRSDSGISPVIFIVNRLLRIAPMYWMLTILMGAAVLVRPDLFRIAEFSTVHFLKSVFFLPHFHPRIENAVMPLLVPGWTLNYEMYFYLVLGCCIAVTKKRTTALTTISILTGFLIGTALESRGAFYVFLGNPIAFEFIFGMLLGEAYLRGYLLPHQVARPLAIASFAAIVLTSDLNFRIGTAGAAAALLVYSLLSVQTSIGGALRDVLRFIGDSSYSLYLTHIFTIGLVGVAWKKASAPLITSSIFTSLTYLVITTALSVAVGGLVFLMIERRIIAINKKATKRWLDRPKS